MESKKKAENVSNCEIVKVGCLPSCSPKCSPSSLITYCLAYIFRNAEKFEILQTNSKAKLLLTEDIKLLIFQYFQKRGKIEYSI